MRAAASLCVHLARAGGCALLLPGDRRPTVLEPTLVGWPHLHVRLALVDDRAGAERRRAGRRAAGPLLYVAARHPARAPRALSHAVGGGRYLIVPGGDGLPERVPGERRTERRAGGRARGVHAWPAAPATS